LNAKDKVKGKSEPVKLLPFCFYFFTFYLGSLLRP